MHRHHTRSYAISSLFEAWIFHVIRSAWLHCWQNWNNLALEYEKIAKLKVPSMICHWLVLAFFLFACWLSTTIKLWFDFGIFSEIYRFNIGLIEQDWEHTINPLYLTFHATILGFHFSSSTWTSNPRISLPSYIVRFRFLWQIFSSIKNLLLNKNHAIRKCLLSLTMASQTF